MYHVRYALVLVGINLHIKFELPSFIHSKDMVCWPQHLTTGHVTPTTPF